MLIEFRVENHRSLRDEQVFTMQAGRIGNDDDPRPRSVKGHSEQLLPVGVLYGANASGKSNVLGALQFMRHAVVESLRVWEPDSGVPRDPFAWGPKRTEPSLFEVTMLIDAVRYQYGFVASDERFLEEWLRAWPNGKKQIWFERDESDFKFGEHLKGENKLIEEVTRPNALFLSAAVQLRHEQLQPIFTWFRRILSFSGPSRWRTLPYLPSEFFLERLIESEDKNREQLSLFADDDLTDPLLEQFRSLLRSADIGILDFRVKRDQPLDPPRRTRRIQFRHQSAVDDAWLPLDEESRGTQMLFRIGLPILQAMQSGGVVVIDELESSLHPILAQQIIRLFNERGTNPRNAQLIFTTHDTNLLGTTLDEPVLRRDQVWLTEKDTEGATVLYPLTDFKPRKAENIERGYLQGRYGAIPIVGGFFFSGGMSRHAEPSP